MCVVRLRRVPGRDGPHPGGARQRQRRHGRHDLGADLRQERHRQVHYHPVPAAIGGGAAGKIHLVGCCLGGSLGRWGSMDGWVRGVGVMWLCLCASVQAHTCAYLGVRAVGGVAVPVHLCVHMCGWVGWWVSG